MRYSAFIHCQRGVLLRGVFWLSLFGLYSNTMASFDVAIALSQSELNKAAQAVYKKVFPKVFSGSIQVEQNGIKYIEWIIAAAPQFNLSLASVQNSVASVATSLWQKSSSTNSLLSSQDRVVLSSDNSKNFSPKPALSATETELTQSDVHELVGSNMATFEIDFPNVGVNFTPDNNGNHTVYQLTNVRAGCYVKIVGSTLSFVPQTVTCDPLPNPTDQFFVKLIILPAIQQALDSLLSGLVIPPISFNGVALSAPSVAIVDGHVVAAVNLAAKGTPAAAPDGSWTGEGFSLLLSQDIIQAAAAGQGKSFSDSGSGGSHWGGYDWGYSLSLVNPSVAISGSNLAITFSLAGSVSATAYVLQIPIGIGFDAQALPNPTAVCTLQPQGGQVAVVTQSVSPFTVLVVPSGSIPSKIAGWIVEGIVQAVVASVSPIISQFLGGITFTSVDIPTFSENIEGVTITLTPTNMAVSNVNGYIALGGSLAVS